MAKLCLNSRYEKRCFEQLGWKFYDPENRFVVDEGWKLHVSGKSSNAPAILTSLEDGLVESGVAFKFLPTTQAINEQTGSQCGKWLVIHPNNIVSAFIALNYIDGVLSDIGLGRDDSPEICGERHVGTTVVYTQYGGFNDDYVLSNHGLVPFDGRGCLKPSWIKDPWGDYDPQGSIDMTKLNRYDRWPKHPISTRR